jgi:AraC-like DNA-binding protein/mannose-6-phosphate isomerase-like protein (cupin superfamily)
MEFVRTLDPPHTPSLLRVRRDDGEYNFTILHATYEQTRVRAARVEHVHDVYHVVFYVRGSGQCTLRGGGVDFRPGTLIVSSPGEAHEFGPRDGARCAYREVSFSLERDGRALTIPFHELLSYYAGRTLSPIARPLHTLGERREWIDGAYARVLESLAAARDLLRVHLGMASLFEYLVRMFHDRTIRRDETAPQGVAQAREMIEAHYREGTSVAALAKAVHLSPGYLMRAFKAAYGISPIAYQIELRVAAAANLLRATSFSCTQIAAFTGFGDIYQFSRTFKKSRGVGPTAFRRGGTRGRRRRRSRASEAPSRSRR